MDIDNMAEFSKARGILEALHPDASLFFVLRCYHGLYKPSEYLVFLEITIDNPRGV